MLAQFHKLDTLNINYIWNECYYLSNKYSKHNIDITEISCVLQKPAFYSKLPITLYEITYLFPKFTGNLEMDA